MDSVAVVQIAKQVAPAPAPGATVERIGNRDERRALVGRYRSEGTLVIEIVEVDGALQSHG